MLLIRDCSKGNVRHDCFSITFSHFDPNSSRRSACCTQSACLEGLTEVFSLKLRRNQIKFKGQPLLQVLPAPWPRQITLWRLNAFSPKILQMCLNAYQKKRRSEMRAIVLIRFLCSRWICSKCLQNSLYIYGQLDMLVSLFYIYRSAVSGPERQCIFWLSFGLWEFRHERCFVVFVSLCTCEGKLMSYWQTYRNDGASERLRAIHT